MDKLLEQLMSGRFTESLGITSISVEESNGDVVSLSESTQAKTKEGLIPSKLLVTVEAIHAGMTKNKTFYPAENLEKSTPTWTSPYERPVIRNHDTWTEPTGRVKSAEFKSSVLVPDGKTIQLTLEITDPDAVQKVMDGRYKTLSIGGSTNAATCSVCAKNVVETGWCGHSRGKTYEGKQAYWIIGEMEFDEISWVNVPADVNAQVIDIKTPERRSESVEEDLDLVDNILESTQTNSEGITEGNTEDNTTETPVTESTEPVAENTDEPSTETPDVAAELEEAKKEIERLQEELNTANESVTTLTDAKAVLEADALTSADEITALKEERDEFRNKNITLAKLVHKSIAERATDIAILKDAALERETVLAENLATPAKVLEGKISDLLTKEVTPVREMTKVTSPGLVVESAHSIEDEEGDITESTKQEKKTELTIQDLANNVVKFLTQTNNQ